MEEFIRSTAVEMEKPAAYGAFHLTFMLVGFAIVIPLAYFLAKKLNAKQSRVLIFSVGVALLISEIYKQLFYTYVYGGGIYQWYMFPIQICSTTLYVCLAAPFLKTPKAESRLYGFLSSIVLMGGFISYFSPESMCRDYLNMTIQSFSWHMTMVFIGFFASFSRRATQNAKGYLKVIPTFLSFAGIGFIINLLCYDKSYYYVDPNGVTYLNYVNMFHIGPHRSPLVICRDICDKFGWGVNLVCYLTAVTACGFLFYMAPIVFDKLFHKK